MKTLKPVQQFLAAAVLCLAATATFAADAATGKGVLKRIDAAAGVANINHEPIAALKWPAMTMDFKVADPRQLSALKAGQTVSFGLVKDPTLGYVISHIEAAGPAK